MGNINTEEYANWEEGYESGKESGRKEREEREAEIQRGINKALKEAKGKSEFILLLYKYCKIKQIKEQKQ